MKVVKLKDGRKVETFCGCDGLNWAKEHQGGRAMCIGGEDINDATKCESCGMYIWINPMADDKLNTARWVWIGILILIIIATGIVCYMM